MGRTVLDRLQVLSSPMAVLVVVASFGVVALVDLTTGPDLSVSLFYLLPIVTASLRWGALPGFLVATAAATTWLVIDLASSGQQGHALIPLWNAGIRMGFFSIVIWLLEVLHRAVERETALARTDPLTGLHNRRAFYELGTRELVRAASSGRGVVVAVIDLDDFKKVNDRRGHEAGDQVLRRFAAAARRNFRAVDVLARVGGDEFAIVLPEVDPSAAIDVLQRFQGALASLEEGGIQSSMGVAHSSGGRLTEMLHAADQALYEAKTTQKGSIRLVDLTSGASATARTIPDTSGMRRRRGDTAWGLPRVRVARMTRRSRSHSISILVSALRSCSTVLGTVTATLAERARSEKWVAFRW